MRCISLKQIVLAVVAIGVASAAFAQYVWIDEKGVRQYSDVPPPASVPANRILKQRGAATGSPSSATEANATAASPDKKAPMTTAEKNAEFQKRRAEQLEKQKKADEEAKLAAENAKNCDRARTYKRSLESGERIAQSDKNGERSYLTDEQRSRELREVGQMLDKCK